MCADRSRTLSKKWKAGSGSNVKTVTIKAPPPPMQQGERPRLADQLKVWLLPLASAYTGKKLSTKDDDGCATPSEIWIAALERLVFEAGELSTAARPIVGLEQLREYQTGYKVDLQGGVPGPSLAYLLALSKILFGGRSQAPYGSGTQQPQGFASEAFTLAPMPGAAAPAEGEAVEEQGHHLFTTESARKLLDCIRVIFCDFLRCVVDIYCPQPMYFGQDGIVVIRSIDDCFDDALCRLLRCVADALCPPPEPAEEPCCFPAPGDCNFAVRCPEPDPYCQPKPPPQWSTDQYDPYNNAYVDRAKWLERNR